MHCCLARSSFVPGTLVIATWSRHDLGLLGEERVDCILVIQVVQRVVLHVGRQERVLESANSHSSPLLPSTSLTCSQTAAFLLIALKMSYFEVFLSQGALRLRALV